MDKKKIVTKHEQQREKEKKLRSVDIYKMEILF